MPGQEGAENVGPGSAMSALARPTGDSPGLTGRSLTGPYSASPPPYRCRWVEQRSSSLPAGAEELAMKREQRLRKFRELHLKRVSCPTEAT